MTLYTYDIQGQRRDAEGHIVKFGCVVTCEAPFLHRVGANKLAEAIHFDSQSIEVTHIGRLDTTQRTPWPVTPTPTPTI